MRGTTWRERAAGMAVVVAAVQGATVTASRPAEAAQQPRGVAPTISGFTSAPSAERSIAGRDGADITFRAPDSGQVATLHTFWRRPTRGCAVALHADADGAPAETLASASFADGLTGWI